MHFTSKPIPCRSRGKSGNGIPARGIKDIMKKQLVMLLWLVPVLSFAGVPYLISPTNDPGLSGQQIFSAGIQDYHYWGWGTNAQSSNATVVVASPTINVATNSFSYTPTLSLGASNAILLQATNNDIVVSNG